DERSLIQTIGRAARNQNGRVILYADVLTRSIRRAMEITSYRRKFQQRYNQANGIIPQSIVKKVSEKEGVIKGSKHLTKSDIQRQIIELDAKMREAAQKLDFEKAIEIRDALNSLSRDLVEKQGTELKTGKFVGSMQ
ncbi:MAG: UvrB/UvrC motif-containing protein, partial [Nitrososphaerota archaeon]|nr:UvrB/UvrC motif-containing protein [Nitrososphaerota archaeon]